MRAWVFLGILVTGDLLRQPAAQVLESVRLALDLAAAPQHPILWAISSLVYGPIFLVALIQGQMIRPDETGCPDAGRLPTSSEAARHGQWMRRVGWPLLLVPAFCALHGATVLL